MDLLRDCAAHWLASEHFGTVLSGRTSCRGCDVGSVLSNTAVNWWPLGALRGMVQLRGQIFHLFFIWITTHGWWLPNWHCHPSTAFFNLKNSFGYGCQGSPHAWFSLAIVYIMFEKSESVSCSVVFDSLHPHELYSGPGSLWSWNSPGKNTGVGSHFLL